MSFLEFSVEDEIIKLIDLTNMIKRYVVLYFKIWMAQITHNKKCVGRAVSMYHTQGTVAGDSVVTSRRGKETDSCFLRTRKPFPEGPQ